MTTQITGDAAARPGCSPEVEPALGGLNGSATSPPIAVDADDADDPILVELGALRHRSMHQRRENRRLQEEVLDLHAEVRVAARRLRQAERRVVDLKGERRHLRECLMAARMLNHTDDDRDGCALCKILERVLGRPQTHTARGIEVAEPARPAAERGSTSGESPVPQGTRPDPSPGVVS